LIPWQRKIRRECKPAPRRRRTPPAVPVVRILFPPAGSLQPLGPSRRDLFWFDLVARGLWFAKRRMFALSIVLDDSDFDKLADAVDEFAETRALCASVGPALPAR
jgi:hypothetical protein